MTTSPEPAPPPVTGLPRIDEALAALDLGEDVATHPEQLTRVLEVLQQELNTPTEER